MERWKSINNFPIAISDLGRVRYEKSGKVSYGSMDKFGYMRISSKSIATGKIEYFKVHRLVAMCFVDGYNDRLVVHHIDHNRSNNNYKNLKMMTASENIKERYVYDADSFSSRHVGVNFHKGIDKWVARCLHEGVRVPLGSYRTEDEAAMAISKFKNGKLTPRFGKGSSNKSKYSDEFINEVVDRSLVVGVNKCAMEYNLGTTTISQWRKKLNKRIKDRKGKTVDGVFVKEK